MKELAEDYEFNENLLYNWRWEYTSDNDKKKCATLEEENRTLRGGGRGDQNGALHVKITAGCFTSLQN